MEFPRRLRYRDLIERGKCMRLDRCLGSDSKGETENEKIDENKRSYKTMSAIDESILMKIL